MRIRDADELELDDILLDIEGARRAEDGVRELLERAASETRSIGLPVAAVSSRNQLIATCEPDTQRRWRTLLAVEAGFPSDGDHGLLIAPACSVLESQLGRLLLEPARGIAGGMCEALRCSKKNRRQSELIERWAEGKVPSTIGVASIVLLALRRGWEQQAVIVQDFLSREFTESYIGLLGSNALGKTLDVVRNRFRNPACHGLSEFGIAAYEEFAELLVGNRRLAQWDEAGPESGALDDGRAVLHHQLAGSRTVSDNLTIEPPIRPDEGASEVAGAPLASPIEGLLAVRTPPESPLRVTLRAHRADSSPATRDIAVGPPAAEAFRLGDAIRFETQANLDGHLVLVDVGTSGAANVLWPNHWHRDSAIRGGEPLYLPSLEGPELQFALTGRPGTERVLALLTADPIPVELAPTGNAPFRKLEDAHLAGLLQAIEQLPPQSWASTVLTFEISA